MWLMSFLQWVSCCPDGSIAIHPPLHLAGNKLLRWCLPCMKLRWGWQWRKPDQYGCRLDRSNKDSTVPVNQRVVNKVAPPSNATARVIVSPGRILTVDRKQFADSNLALQMFPERLKAEIIQVEDGPLNTGRFQALAITLADRSS